MTLRCYTPSKKDLVLLKTLLAYQYGIKAAEALDVFNIEDLLICISSATGRIRTLKMSDGTILFTLRASDYMILPHLVFAQVLKEFLPFPKYRVIIVNEMVEDVLEGWTIFSRHVLNADEEIRAGDEVLIVTEDDELIAVGRALIGYDEIITADYGAAITIRDKVIKHGKTRI
ncbi:MAG TPA: hypothetical protein ENF93_01505 [Ignisphaera sp.]|nr:hypothetical protein [Ignisphaera sp.]